MSVSRHVSYITHKDVPFILYSILSPETQFLLSTWVLSFIPATGLENLCFLPILLPLYFQANIHVIVKDLRILNLILPNPFFMSSTILLIFAIISHHPLIFDPLFLSVGGGRSICLHELSLLCCLKSTNNLLTGVPSNPSKHHYQNNFYKARLSFITPLYDL